MKKIRVYVSTNKVGSKVERSFSIDDEDLEDEAFVEELVNETVNDMINVHWEVEDES